VLRQGADNVKQQIDDLGKDPGKLSPADRSKLWSGLGTAVLAVGDREGAEKYFGRVADANPDDIRIRFSLLEIARDTGDDAVLSRVQNDIARIMGKESAEARFVEAARAVALVRKSIKDRTVSHTSPPPDAAEKQSLAAARKLLEQVSQVRPGWYEVSRVQGDLELLDGNIDNAISQYQLALKNGPPNPVTERALIHLLAQRHRTDELNELLDKLDNNQQLASLDVKTFKVEKLVNEKKFDEAIKMAENQVPLTSTDPYNQMWIANLYEKGGQSDKAEARFRRAVETGSELPETWLMLIDHLVNNKKAEQASKVLDEARKKLPEDRVNQVLGPGFEAMGRSVEAEEYYKAAVLAQPDDLALHRLIAMFYLRQQRLDDARREVDTILRDAPKDLSKNMANLLWARRAKADLLARTGRFDDFQRAKELLLENAKLSDDDSEDKLRLATLLASRVDEPSSWREAVTWLDKIKNLPDQQKMTLARLHDVLGEWSLARREMLQLVTTKADPRAYGLFVEMLIRHNEVVDAADWLDKLDKVQPGAGLLLRARVLVRQGRPHDAVALLRRIVPSKPVPEDKVGALRTVAFLMDQLGLDDAAEEMFRDYITYNPGEGSLHLAAFLGRHGRLDEALDLCEQSVTTYKQPVATVAQIACNALRAQPTRVKPEHAARVEKWFDRLIKEEPDSVPLLLQYADFFDVTGRDVDSEKRYRELLARKDLRFGERAMALNNLAFALAMQKKSLPEALEFANQAMQLLGQTSDLLDTRGMVYLSMENFAAAANDFSEAVLVQDPSPLKLLHLAYAQDMAGDRLGARQTLLRAKDMKLDTDALSKIEQGFYAKIVHDVGP
jgi:tetratricopeptide (TPR) repeat protein